MKQALFIRSFSLPLIFSFLTLYTDLASLFCNKWCKTTGDIGQTFQGKQVYMLTQTRLSNIRALQWHVILAECGQKYDKDILIPSTALWYLIIDWSLSSTGTLPSHTFQVEMTIFILIPIYNQHFLQDRYSACVISIKSKY